MTDLLEQELGVTDLFEQEFGVCAMTGDLFEQELGVCTDLFEQELGVTDLFEQELVVTDLFEQELGVGAGTGDQVLGELQENGEHLVVHVLAAGALQQVGDDQEAATLEHVLLHHRGRLHQLTDKAQQRGAVGQAGRRRTSGGQTKRCTLHGEVYSDGQMGGIKCYSQTITRSKIDVNIKVYMY